MKRESCQVFLSIFFTYVAMGMAFFGREVESFASFDRACLALLEALLLAYHLSFFFYFAEKGSRRQVISMFDHQFDHLLIV